MASFHEVQEEGQEVGSLNVGGDSTGEDEKDENDESQEGSTSPTQKPDRLRSKIGKGRLIGKGIGAGLATFGAIRDALPGAQIRRAARKRVVGGVVNAVVPEKAKTWVKEKAAAAGKAVLKNEVGRNVTVGLAQGKKGADDTMGKASVSAIPILLAAPNECKKTMYACCCTTTLPRVSDRLFSIHAVPPLCHASTRRVIFRCTLLSLVSFDEDTIRLCPPPSSAGIYLCV